MYEYVEENLRPGPELRPKLCRHASPQVTVCAMSESAEAAELVFFSQIRVVLDSIDQVVTLSPRSHAAIATRGQCE